MHMSKTSFVLAVYDAPNLAILLLMGAFMNLKEIEDTTELGTKLDN